jgi:hypothetical protein
VLPLVCDPDGRFIAVCCLPRIGRHGYHRRASAPSTANANVARLTRVTRSNVGFYRGKACRLGIIHLGVNAFGAQYFTVGRGKSRPSSSQLICEYRDHGDPTGGRQLVSPAKDTRPKSRLSGNHEPQFDEPRKGGQRVNPVSRFFDVLSTIGFSFGNSVVRSVPKNSMYVNVGHMTLKVPCFVFWLKRRADVTRER